MPDGQQLSPDESSWLQKQDLGDTAERMISSAWAEDEGLRCLNVSTLAALLLAEDKDVIDAFVSGGVRPMVLRGLIAKLRAAAQAAQVAQAVAAQAAAAAAQAAAAQEAAVQAAAQTGLLQDLKTSLAKVSDTVAIVASLQAADFVYSTGKASTSRQGDTFKEELQQYYDDIPGEGVDKKLRCMLLDVRLPLSMVTGAHIFKHCWRFKMKALMEIGNIDDPRNGLLLCRPLEQAFDDSRLCFSYEDVNGQPKFTLELLDPELHDKKIWEYAAGDHNKFKGYSLDQLDPEAQLALSLTFGELQGKALVFTNNNYPYKRCLGFHAKQAIARARTENWLPSNWVPAAALSYTSDAAIRTQAWLNSHVL